MRGWILAWREGDAARIGRTQRSLLAAGIEPTIITSYPELVEHSRAVHEAVLLIAAGTWLVQEATLAAIPSSASGRPLIAFGAVRRATGAASPEAEQWRALLAKRGGDFDQRRILAPQIPAPHCALLAPEALRAFCDAQSWEQAWRRFRADRAFRKVHLPTLDVRDDRRLRVLQVVTSIQLGGAERVTLDLAHELARRGIATAVAALGRATRPAFPEPPHFFDLSETSRDPAVRAAAVSRAARTFGANLVHGHLLTGAECRAIRAHGLPLVLTLHNMPDAWPAGFQDLRVEDADLILACSRAVEAAAVNAGLPIPVRTVWNGIDTAPCAPSPKQRAAGRKLRHDFGWADEDFVVLAVANPRRQKRLDRLPAILERLQAQLGKRPARLLLVGAPARGSDDAESAARDLDAAIAACPLRTSIEQLGAVVDISTALAASDVLISVSAFEGLSLAHLEALAAGLPVVATDAGGTREIAALTDAVRLLPPNTSDAAFAEALHWIAREDRPRESSLPRDFTRGEMAARTASFYPQILCPRGTSGDGLWLITNNFSTGGAQSSARRLLLGLAERGVKVRAIVIEEHPAHPTLGRIALKRAGVPVLAVPALDAPQAAARILAAIAADRPRAVIFWNLIAVHKILLADALLDVPVFDVSPGEMYFASLARYFDKPRAALPYRTAQDYGARLAGVVVKYDAEREIAAQTLGAPVHVIRNGVPLCEPLTTPHRERRLVFGTAARLSPDKRLGDLLEAVRLAKLSLPDFVLRIAGGPERGHEGHARELREQTRGLPVEWCGELPDTNAFLDGLDLFVMISEPSGCPNASLEAMAAGVPVIATHVGGACEQIVHGVTGLLTPPRDHTALATAIGELATDPVRRESFAQAARERIRAEFSLDRMLDDYARLCGLGGVPHQ